VALVRHQRRPRVHAPQPHCSTRHRNARDDERRGEMAVPVESSEELRRKLPSGEKQTP
jgi:hypothetical protein